MSGGPGEWQRDKRRDQLEPPRPQFANQRRCICGQETVRAEFRARVPCLDHLIQNGAVRLVSAPALNLDDTPTHWGGAYSDCSFCSCLCCLLVHLRTFLCLCDFYPLPGLSGFERRIEHSLAPNSVQQRRRAGAPEPYAFDKLKLLIIAVAPAGVPVMDVAHGARQPQKLRGNLTAAHRPGRIASVFP